MTDLQGAKQQWAAIHYNITENWEYLLAIVLSGQIINHHLPTDHFTHFPNTKYNLFWPMKARRL